MKNPDSTNSHDSHDATIPQDTGFSPWRRLNSKRISYLALPLIVMATVVEFVILSIGWKYQKTVCLPQGMGVTFLGIGPIGATILMVELLKLPLAAWTASRHGWQKGMMLVVGLPLICVLTFQLVKDMAVYEMGVAMTPASQMLEKATDDDTKIAQLQGDLAGIQTKKADSENQIAELAARKAKAKADIEDALKRNDEMRLDAINLTDYQKKELADVDSREATIIQQFNSDSEQINKAIADLRAVREVEVARASKWNAEEARIDNAYKAEMADYENKKSAYEKAKAEYDNANFLKRQLMREPVDPGVPPVREDNTILKPAEIADIDAQIKAKEAELLAVNNKRRESVALVEADARQLRESFDTRSGTKREEADRKRDELLASLAALETSTTAEEKQINQEYQAAAQNVDGIQAEIDACSKQAEADYEERETDIKKTQVYRIATTVEIVRGLLMGQHPVTIKATAKERGDLYTDQISMVRIWVYPVLAFIVAFLPTLMVEIGFSTLFMPEQKRPSFRLGFFGRRLHWLYIRAGRQKILRAERIAREASTEIAQRDKALAAANATAENALAAKEAELQAAQVVNGAAAAEHEEQLKQKEGEWVAKFTGLADSLNRAVAENETLRDLQKSEIERQVQARQNAWSDRLTQMRKELDNQHAASEAERTALIQEHHRKLQVLSEDCKTQVIQARRQVADTELATEETSARLTQELKEAKEARDLAESQLKHQAGVLSLQLAQAKEHTDREVEKAVRQERHRLERQQSELDKTRRQRDEDFEHRWKQREQELSLAFDARLVEEKNKVEEDARRRETELERQLESRAREVDAHWTQEVQQRDEAAQIKLKQREQQLLAQAEVRMSDAQAEAEEKLRRRETELERQFDAQSREFDARLRQELQQKELVFHAKLKQCELELTARAAARETELQNQWASDLRAREDDWQRQIESRIRSTEARWGHDAKQKEEIFQTKIRQREQELNAQFDARQTELKAKWDQDLHNRQEDCERNAEASIRATESRWKAEIQQHEELLQSKLRQRDQQWQVKLDTLRTELQAQTEQELRRHEAESADTRSRAAHELEASLRKEMQDKQEAAQVETKQREQAFVARLAAQAEACKKAEKERDEAMQSASEDARQAQDLKNKLMEASSLLSGWKTRNANGNGNGNGKHLVEAGVGRNGFYGD
jgi:hypothetical protein